MYTTYSLTLYLQDEHKYNLKLDYNCLGFYFYSVGSFWQRWVFTITSLLRLSATNPPEQALALLLGHICGTNSSTYKMYNILRLQGALWTKFEKSKYVLSKIWETENYKRKVHGLCLAKLHIWQCWLQLICVSFWLSNCFLTISCMCIYILIISTPLLLYPSIPVNNTVRNPFPTFIYFWFCDPLTWTRILYDFGFVTLHWSLVGSPVGT